MSVNTYAARERRKPSYICNRQYHDGAAHTCQSMSAQPIDDVVAALFLEAMVPAQIELALQVVDDLCAEKHALQQQWEQQLQQARYAAQLAQRQYDAVDPDHRLVAATLEQRWNEKLQALQDLEQAYRAAQTEAHFTLTEAEKSDIRRLAHDLPAVWQAPSTTDRERKQLLRFLIAEVQLDGVGTPGTIDIRVTWRSGALTTRRIARLKVGAWAPRTEARVIVRIRDLAPTHRVAQIVEILNAEGLRSAHGRVLREHHVLYLARRHHIEVTTSARLLQRSAHNDD
jgi:hypothetical protein